MCQLRRLAVAQEGTLHIVGVLLVGSSMRADKVGDRSIIKLWHAYVISSAASSKFPWSAPALDCQGLLLDTQAKE